MFKQISVARYAKISHTSTTVFVCVCVCVCVLVEISIFEKCSKKVLPEDDMCTYRLPGLSCIGLPAVKRCDKVAM